MARRKEITVVYPKDAEKKFKNKIFRSYGAVAKELKPGENVTVAVYEINTEVPKSSYFHKFLEGYGDVGVDPKNPDMYSCPRRLCPEF